MELGGHKRDWETMSELDPFWAVLSLPEFRDGRGDPAAFFESGREEMDRVFGQTAVHGLPSAWRSALDFGCGLGRLTAAMASRFDEAVGVDISTGMVEQARRLHAGTANCTFVVNEATDLALFPDDRFDFVYTCIVLQHVPSRAAIRSYIRDFYRVVRPGGTVVFQLPPSLPLANRLKPRKHLYRFLRKLGFSSELVYRRFRLNPMQMNYLPEAEVVALVESAGADVLEVEHRKCSATIPSCVYITKRRA